VVEERVYNGQVGKVGGYYCPNSTGKTQTHNGKHVHLELAGGAHHHVCIELDAISNIVLM
jgi:hypothetical protein